MEEVRHDLESLALRFRESYSQDSVAIFDIYLHLLNDPGYIKPIRNKVSKEHWTAISAVKLISDRLIEQFKGDEGSLSAGALHRCERHRPAAHQPAGAGRTRAAHHRRTRGAGRR